MVIDDKLLEKLEELSAIKIDVDKKENVRRELSDILNFVENLNELKIPDDKTIKSNTATIRDDYPIKSDVADKILENAPESSNRLFIVPRIVE